MRHFGTISRKVSSWYSRAVSGSSERLNWSSQRNSKRALLKALSRYWAPGCPLARSAAWAAIFISDHTILYIFFIGQTQVFFGRYITQHRSAIPTNHRRANGRSNMIVARCNICGQRAEGIKRRFVTMFQLFVHVLFNHVHWHVARTFDHGLNIVLPGNFGSSPSVSSSANCAASLASAIVPGRIHRPGESYIVRFHDFADFFKMRIEKIFLVMRQTPFGHDGCHRGIQYR